MQIYNYGRAAGKRVCHRFLPYHRSVYLGSIGKHSPRCGQQERREAPFSVFSVPATLYVSTLSETSAGRLLEMRGLGRTVSKLGEAAP